MNNSNLNELAERYIYLKQQVKEIYKELDDLTEFLVKKLGAEDENEIETDEYIIKVVDNFKDKNTVFRPAACKRFEIKIEEL